jgi:response regulator of citrate/malate metabolism
VKQEFPDARVVMVSAVDQKEMLTECIRLGAADFIVKPFDKARLKSFFTKYGRDETSTYGRDESPSATAAQNHELPRGEL